MAGTLRSTEKLHFRPPGSPVSPTNAVLAQCTPSVRSQVNVPCQTPSWSFSTGTLIASTNSSTESSRIDVPLLIAAVKAIGGRASLTHPSTAGDCGVTIEPSAQNPLYV